MFVQEFWSLVLRKGHHGKQQETHTSMLVSSRAEGRRSPKAKVSKRRNMLEISHSNRPSMDHCRISATKFCFHLWTF